MPSLPQATLVGGCAELGAGCFAVAAELLGSGARIRGNLHVFSNNTYYISHIEPVSHLKGLSTKQVWVSTYGNQERGGH